MSTILAASTGLALGLRHAFEPDHLAAVGTFLPRDAAPRSAAAIGALWGFGHAAAILAALKSGVLTGLITDEATATVLASEAQGGPEAATEPGGEISTRL